MKEYLKVKVLSLIAERRIIKTQAERTGERLHRRLGKIAETNNRQHQAEMTLHCSRDSKARDGLIRHEEELAYESRLTGLAYGFVRGRSYPQMESKLRYHGDKTKKLTDEQLKYILAMVQKYDENKHDVAQRWGKFLQDAEAVPIVRPAPFSRRERVVAYEKKWTPDRRAAAKANSR